MRKMLTDHLSFLLWGDVPYNCAFTGRYEDHFCKLIWEKPENRETAKVCWGGMEDFFAGPRQWLLGINRDEKDVRKWL